MNELQLKTGDSVILSNDILNDIKHTLENLGHLHWIKDNELLKISQGYIGQIFGENNSLVISPSISYLSTLDYLKLVTPDSDLLQDGDNFEFIEDNKISMFIIEKYMNLLHKLIKEGIPRKYIDSSQYSNYFSGNVDIPETYSRVLMEQKPFVKSNIQTLSINYFVVVILWQAYDKIIKEYPSLKNPFIEKVFFYVNKMKFSNLQIKNFRTYFHKNEALLADSYTFAKLILNDMNVLAGSDMLKTSLLINSNIIFEEFISKLFSTLLPNESFVYHDGQKAIAQTISKKLVSIEPDILYKGLETIILDVKNKDYNKMFSNNDFFQIYTYCKAYKSKTGVLIYPANQASESIKVLTTFDEDITLYAISIDITKKSNNERMKSYEDFIDNIRDIIYFT